MSKSACSNSSSGTSAGVGSHSAQGFHRRDDSQGARFFENLPELISLEKAAVLLNRKIKTFYDWRYRGSRRKRHKIPESLFVELNGQLFMNTAELIRWLSFQNPHSL